MMTIKKIAKLLMVVLTFIFPAFALADGAPIPKPDYYVTETDQKAVIIEKDSKEVLILSITFKGDPKDFAWIIPTPTEPEVAKSYDDIFNGLAQIAQAKTSQEPLAEVSKLGLTQKEEAPVKVIKTQTIEYYDITTLSSTNAEALSSWLTQNGYQFPEKAASSLEDYINNKWFFVAVKIDPSKLSKTAEEQLVTGHATPLQLTFETEKLVYPLKISSIIEQYEPKTTSTTTTPTSTENVANQVKPQVEELVSISLYVLSDHKKEASQFTTLYANQVSSDKIKAAATDSAGNPWYEPKTQKIYLTSLARTMKPSEMTNDIFVLNAPDNKPVNTGQESSLGARIILGIITFLIGLVVISLSPLGLIFVVAILAQILAKSKIIKIIGWVFQAIFGLALVALIGVYVLILINSAAFTSENLITNNFVYEISALAAMVVVLGGEILAVVFQIRYWQKEEEKHSQIGDRIFDVKRK